MGPEGGTWRPDSARMTHIGDALVDCPQVGDVAGKVDTSEVNRGRPRGKVADRPPYRGGLSATTKIVD